MNKTKIRISIRFLTMILSLSLFATPVFAEGGNNTEPNQENFSLEPLKEDELNVDGFMKDDVMADELMREEPITDNAMVPNSSSTDGFLAPEQPTSNTNENFMHLLPQDPISFTPDGNLSWVDDIEGEQSKDKQFITMQSKNGNFFYLVIDREGDKENVYFLNLVDGADLMSLIEDDEIIPIEPTPCEVCTEKCEVGSINTAWPVCSVDKNACNGTELSTIEPVETEETTNSSIPMVGVALLIAFLGGCGFYFLKVKTPKQDNKGKTNLDEYDFDEDDEEEYNFENHEDI